MVGQVIGGGEVSSSGVEEGDACGRVGVDEGDARLGVGVGVEDRQPRLFTFWLMKNRYNVGLAQPGV